MMFPKNSKDASTTFNKSGSSSTGINLEMTNNNVVDKGKVKVGEVKKEAMSRKKRANEDKAFSEPAKKQRKTQKSPSKSVSSSTPCMAKVGLIQPRQMP